MKKFLSAAVSTLLLLFLSTPGLSQTAGFATVSGTVTDSSGALIPGVSITATAVDTGVVTTTLTNEAGTYTFASLLPGNYRLSASLPGFQTKNLTGITLGQGTAYRFNFDLTVAGVDTQVEVSIAADTALATSGATIGQVLTQQRVSDLPMVGNNVLQLIGVLSGVENATDATFGREGTTFAGISAANITTVRDGIMVQDTRWPTGINSATVINPDLVGEVRLILAPVDAEIGRGNGTVQIQTRSGTNRYTGSAVWSFRNTALDPNSWGNNENQTFVPGVPTNPDGSPHATERNWSNVHQGTISFGGPIIRNKTFFYALYDHNDARGRVSTNFTVLTPCARNGVMRYFPNWNSGNINTATSGTSNTTAIRASVDPTGSPVAPTTNPNGSPYTETLHYFSVFGSLPSNPTSADCSDVVNPSTLSPNGSPTFFDPYRQAIDPTGYINRLIAYMPLPNNYEAGDGLNRAGFRWLRHTRGLDNLWGVGEATGLRNQYNVKIDHNFTTNHKANVNVSYERVDSDDTVMAYPNTFNNLNYRRPLVVTAAFTSTLSSSLLNEARFGVRRTGTNVVAPWDRPEYEEEINALLPPRSSANGFQVFPRYEQLLASGFGATGVTGVCNPVSGGRPNQNAGSGNCFAGIITTTAIDVTPVYTYADTLSWTRGAHSFRFGGEVRMSSSKSKVNTPNFFSDYGTYAQALGGNSDYAPQDTSSSGINLANPATTGIANTDRDVARGLQNYLSGSLDGIRHLYFIADPDDLSTWADGRTHKFKETELKQTEVTAFIKDDYKLSRSLTLNLGVRWEYYSVPYVASGLTVSPVGGSAAAFGISGRDFTGFWNPGERAGLTDLEFVGPNSPNPDRKVYNSDRNNFGPAIGFAWQVPWFGEGRTTVRGGYQVTFQTRGFSTIENVLASPPGATYNSSYDGDATNNPYLDLTDLATALPGPVPVLPMQPIPLTDRGSDVSFFDANYVHPYVQNLTLSVTRSLRSNMTVDVRYVGTLARKQFTSFPLNSINFLSNGLLEEFNSIRTGTDTTPILDSMLGGVNLCATGCGPGSWGPIGTTVNGVLQTPALQMRSSSAGTGGFGASVRGDLANANYTRLAEWLNTTNVGVPSTPAGVRGALLRQSGLFPENFITTNPQFDDVNLLTNMGYNNYHSVQTEFTLRPTQGISGQVTYSWSKNLGLAAGFTNPADRALDYTHRGNNRAHQLRTNGTIELPFGPNRFLLGNSSGWLARAIERWQLGLIYNLSSGAPTSITATNMLYGNGRPDIAMPVDFNDLKGMRWGSIVSGNFLDGAYFDPSMFTQVSDPQCTSQVTSMQGLNAGNRCTLEALAMVVPAGTPGAIPFSDTDPSTGMPRTGEAVVVLQHPQPGTRGNLGSNTLTGLGTWRFDANLSKTFRISESKSLQVRIDTLNVLNHPQPSNPDLSITGTGIFGRSTSKSGNRAFQGQLRFTF